MQKINQFNKGIAKVKKQKVLRCTTDLYSKDKILQKCAVFGIVQYGT